MHVAQLNLGYVRMNVLNFVFPWFDHTGLIAIFLSQALISTVTVLVHGAPEREKGQRQGASRALPLSRDCNSVLRA